MLKNGTREGVNSSKDIAEGASNSLLHKILCRYTMSLGVNSSRRKTQRQSRGTTNRRAPINSQPQLDSPSLPD